MSIPVETSIPVPSVDIPRAQLWTGRVLSALAVLFLLFDAIGKLIRPPQVVEGTVQLGWPASVILTLGIIQVVCLILYLLPRTPDPAPVPVPVPGFYLEKKEENKSCPAKSTSTSLSATSRSRSSSSPASASPSTPSSPTTKPPA